jgi:hypothetical protein
MDTLLCLASLVLLAPIGYIGLKLLYYFIKAIYIFGLKLDPWLIAVTLAGLVVGTIALLLLLTK